MIKLILIIDPRNLILGNPSTFNRHKFYSESLEKVTRDGFKLGVISFHPHSNFSIELIDNLYSIKIPRDLILRRKTQKRFTMQFTSFFNVHLLIAGDPWESFFSAVLFSKMIQSNPRIQVQAHGDIGNRDWINLNWRNRIRSCIACFTLKAATEIRAVTELQANQLSNQYDIQRDKIFVIPVPSFYFRDEVSPSPSTVRPNTIGLIGRIQHDRGLDAFVELTRKLAQLNHDFSVLVVGTGDLREKLEGDLGQYLTPKRISFLGNIEPTNMHKVWSKLGVLVSCAPAESYGRAMRESLVHGVPVWATKSSCAIDLSTTAGEAMRFLNLADSAAELNQTFKELVQQRIDVRLQADLLKSDRAVISKLIASWIDPPANGSNPR